MVSPAPVRRYLLQCLPSTAATLDALVGGETPDSAFWDYRPDCDRFTAREVLAHLADWNAIFQERISRTLAEDTPMLLGIDEELLASENDYTHQDPGHSLRRFKVGRADLQELLEGLDDAGWSRRAVRDSMGEITVLDQAVIVAGHDAYHLREVAEYLLAWRNQPR